MTTPNISMAGTTLNLIDKNDSVQAQFDLTTKETFRIGRSDTSDIRLAFSWVSRQHAMIQIEENGSCNVIDLGSANGTFVNGRRIFSPTRINNGDRIGIGQTILILLQQQVAAPPQLFDPDLEEKTVAFVNHQQVTVLVADIRDFTSLAETIGDHQTGHLLQVWNSLVSEVIKQHDGMVDKFIGDAVMALWLGAPGPRHNILQALTAALRINQLSNELHKKIPQIPWQLKTGAAINTGEAVVGNMGGSGRRDFTVIGDAVNVVFRLESLTGKTGHDILIGNEAAASLEDPTSHFSRDQYYLKGKKDKVTAFGTSFTKLEQFLAGTGNG